MKKSLLIGLILLTSAARASAQTAGGPYTWVPVTVPYVEPPNAVKAPAFNGRSMVACKGKDQATGFLWAGYLEINGTILSCLSDFGGTRQVATDSVRVLTVTVGIPKWTEVMPKNQPGVIGTPLPINVINAGITRSNYAMVLCAQGGYVGWVYGGRCALAASDTNGFMTATVLTW
jgi:hypothetical protein